MTAVSSLLFLAQTSAAPAGPGGLLGNPMVFPVLMIVMMYFLLIRPQRKKAKELEQLQKSGQVGDQIITIGGVHGIISSVKEKTFMVKIADNVKVELDKSAVATVIKKSDAVVTPEVVTTK